MDIARTIQAEEHSDWVERLFDGKELTGKNATNFPLKARPSKARVGDWLYLIYRGRIHGRLRITEIEQVDKEVPVGTSGAMVRARALVHVQCPGERAPRWIKRRGSQGFTYVSVPKWSA